MATSGRAGKSKIGQRKSFGNPQRKWRNAKKEQKQRCSVQIKSAQHSLSPTGPWQWEKTQKQLPKVSLMNAEQAYPRNKATALMSHICSHSTWDSFLQLTGQQQRTITFCCALCLGRQQADAILKDKLLFDIELCLGNWRETIYG